MVYKSTYNWGALPCRVYRVYHQIAILARKLVIRQHMSDKQEGTRLGPIAKLVYDLVNSVVYTAINKPVNWGCKTTYKLTYPSHYW